MKLEYRKIISQIYSDNIDVPINVRCNQTFITENYIMCIFSKSLWRFSVDP